MMRHPLYAGSALLAAGYVLMSGWWQAALVVAVLFALFYGAAMISEERYLASRYGAEYTKYCARTPRIFPKAWAYRGGTEFSMKQVMNNREWHSVIGVTVFSLLFAARFIPALKGLVI